MFRLKARNVVLEEALSWWEKEEENINKKDSAIKSEDWSDKHSCCSHCWRFYLHV
jgi:hypothetical protein